MNKMNSFVDMMEQGVYWGPVNVTSKPSRRKPNTPKAEAKFTVRVQERRAVFYIPFFLFFYT